MARDDTITIENARIIFRNFGGAPTKYNREGDRNFCILLDPDLSDQMRRDGWNIKTLAAREEGDIEQPYIQVAVSFKNRPPRVIMLSSRGRTSLSEGEIELLDMVDIEEADVILRPYAWEVRDAHGIKAYLQTAYFKLHEDELDLKYADYEDSLPTRSGRIDD